ncbi:MAG: hypothetical protein QG601_2484 [Pseudomonadota bacterium]|jgi:uncharacterized protein (DUF697 family)/tellurite resistance protein|nr:hypothetical protein [Pseudomonadota bacterium]MDQ1311214.1 hypothetical protein [Pseudomonadota bacterium]
MLTLEETRAVLTVALLAAFSDGLKDDREREAVKRVADALGPDAGFDLPGLYRDVLLAKPDLAKVAAELQSPESRQLAYEMAVGVCDADGAQGPAEKQFLAKLAEALSLPAAAASATSARADEVAEAAFAPTEAPAATASAPVSGTVMGKANISDAEMDKLILNASITNAALELLPETLASMAIIPLQMRLVSRIGKAHGYPMDRTHAKDFIATLGVGLTGQYLEQFGRKLLGGLLGGLGGGIGRGVGRQAASSGLTFATTYALGRVAQRYYAAGRTIDTATLKQTFASLLDEARGLAPRYREQIEQKAGTIDVRNLASLVRQA